MAAGSTVSSISKALVCLLLLAGSTVHAQEFPVESFAALRQRFPPDSNQWSRQQFLDYNKQLGSLLVDVVWLYQRPTKPKPPVTSRLSAPRNPPVWDGTTIVLPLSYFHDMTQLGFMLGRDIYTSLWRPLPETKPFTRHAVSGGSLVRALDASLNTVSPFFDANSERIICRQDQVGCLGSQTIAVIGVQLFLVAHECGHYVLNHTGNRSDDQELAADLYAWQTLRHVADALHAKDDETNELNGTLLAAAAEAPLWYERQTVAWNDAVRPGSSPAISNALDRRIGQIESLTDKLKLDAEQFMPALYSNWEVHAVKFRANRVPTLLLINGTPIDPSTIKGGVLRLPDSLVWVVAADQQGVACEKHSSVDGDVQLNLSPWKTATPEQLRGYANEKQWCEVIESAANAKLTPRSPQLAAILNQALNGVHARLFIDASSVSGSDKQTAERYRRIEAGFRKWGVQ